MEEWAASELFDQDYLEFYESRLTDATSDREAGTIWDVLRLNQGDRVLDLACGHGRISNRLAARGAEVIGLDATPMFLELARADAIAKGVSVEYVHGDMRQIPWTGHFDAVVSWFTAYGYFDDSQNRNVLAQIYKALRPGGRALIELNHKEGLLPTWTEASVERLGDALMIDEREWDPLTGRSNNRRSIIRDGAMRQVFFFTRLFSFTELRDWFLEAAFENVEGLAGDGTALTRTSRRMIVIATK